MCNLKFSFKQLVVLLGVAALLGDALYEGLRSVLGPYLSALGAGVITAVMFGVVPEIFVSIGRVSSVFLARALSPIALLALSYIATGVIVPLVGVTGIVTLISVLYCAERFMRGVRGPVRDTILSIAVSREKTGLAFGILEVLDQVGAVLGPAYLTLIIILTGSLKIAIILLAVFTLPLLVVSMLIWSRLRTAERAIPLADLKLSRQELKLTLLLSIPWLATPHFIAYSDMLAHNLRPEILTLSYTIAMAIDALLAVPLGVKANPRHIIIVPAISTLLPLIPTLQTGQIIKAILIGITYGIITTIQEVTTRTIIALHTTQTKRLTTYATTYTTQTIAQIIASILTTKLTTTQYITYTLLTTLTTILLTQIKPKR